MNQYPSRKVVEKLRKKYTVGSIVKLVKMLDEQAPPSGIEGRVLGVDDMGTIHIAWKNGSSLGIVYGEDECVKVEK